MITPENITSHELIGLHTRVIESSNLQLVGLNGTVIDETKSMLKINTPDGPKMIPKDTSTWEFLVGHDRITVPGTKIAKRPYDRLRGSK